MDLVVAFAGSLLVWAAFRAVIYYHQSNTGILLRRLSAGPAPVSPMSSPGENRRLLQGLADRFTLTRPGRRLAAYVEANHPTSEFSDVLALAVAAFIGGGLVGALVFPSGPLPLISAFAAPVAADRILGRIGGKRSSRIDQQLPEALHLQASALRAGHSMVHSMRLVAAASKPPLRDELERMLHRIELGKSQQEALRQFSTRTSSRDVELWVSAMLVHRITGGNLASIVDALAKRVRERLDLRSEINALTAQGRLSGIVVAMAPIGFFILLSITSSEQMEVLYKTPMGWALLALGLAMDAAGFLWIRWILRIQP